LSDRRLLDIPRDDLKSCFGRAAFQIAHSLSEHPLFQLDSLVDLGCRNSRHVQWHRGDLDHDEVRGDLGDPTREQKNTFGARKFPGNGLGIRETIEQIETNGSWMLIREIGEIPEYRRLLEQYMAEVHELVGPLAPGIHKTRSDVVISSPGAITPFHMDEEQNFLLEIRGTKTITIVDGTQEFAVNETDREVFFADNGELHPGRVDKGASHVKLELRPGTGVHIPSFFPHCVTNGNNVSIAVTTMFFTAATERRRELFRIKRWQRALGLPAAPVGTHPRLDAFKLGALEATRRIVDPIRKRLGRHDRPAT
jgi:hypothetical protein